MLGISSLCCCNTISVVENIIRIEEKLNCNQEIVLSLPPNSSENKLLHLEIS